MTHLYFNSTPGTKIKKIEKGFVIWQYPPALIISDVVQM